MEQRIRELLKRLNIIGYCAYEIKSIVQEAVGTDDLDSGDHHWCADAVAVLEKYERLGTDYLHAYSK